MTKILLLTAILLFSLMTLSAEKITFSKKNGTLIVHTAENKSCMLATDAIAYEPYVSPDATWIAVETQLLSNLQILKIYQKNAKGCYYELQPPFSEKVWHDILKNRAVRLEDIIHPRMDFLAWTDSNKIKIHISGDAENSSIDKNLTYELKQPIPCVSE